MKKLIVVRHGKSSWKNPDLADHDRPLKKRGYTDAQLVIKSFRTYFQHPVKMISSTARRAFTTAEMFKEGLELKDENFEVISDLYTFSYEELLEVIKNQPDEDNKLMVFGHNPAMTRLVNELGSESIENLPTTGLVVIDFKADSWKTISNGRTLVTLFPKMFK